MPDKIFSVVSKYQYEMDNEIKKVNAFLKDNPNYEVKSVTPIMKTEDKSYGAFSGVIIVVGEKKGE